MRTHTVLFLFLAGISSITYSMDGEKKEQLPAESKAVDRHRATQLAMQGFCANIIKATTIKELRATFAANPDRAFREQAFCCQTEPYGTVLHCFAMDRPADFIQELFSYGGGIALNIRRDSDGATPLVAAALQENSPDYVRFAAFMSTLPFPMADSARSEFRRDSNVRSWQNIEFLIKSRADVTIPDNQGRTPLIVATKRSDMSLVRQLLEAKANLEAKDSNGRCALVYAQEQAKLPWYNRTLNAKSLIALLKSYQPKKEVKQEKE